MAEPTINGSKLYKEIKPLIDEQSTDGELFLSKVAAKISSYVTSNDSITGAYAGLIPGSPPIPSTLIVAKGCFLPALLLLVLLLLYLMILLIGYKTL